MSILWKIHDILMKFHGSLTGKGYEARFCSALEQSRSPKLQKIQQSPDLGFNMLLQEPQRYKCWEVPLGTSRASVAWQCGQVIVDCCFSIELFTIRYWTENVSRICQAVMERKLLRAKPQCLNHYLKDLSIVHKAFELFWTWAYCIEDSIIRSMYSRLLMGW